MYKIIQQRILAGATVGVGLCLIIAILLALFALLVCIYPGC